MAKLNVVPIYESNFRDPVETLRVIANDIEAGKYGAVGTVAVAVFGDTMEVFGLGVDSDGPTIALVFQAASLRFAREIEKHGRG
jgi:hypothetical protein